MKHTILILFLPLLLSAQTKSERVLDYLGKQRAYSIPDADAVTFTFDALVIERKTTGGNYLDILASGRHYSDADDAGRLLHIQTAKGATRTAIMPIRKKQDDGPAMAALPNTPHDERSAFTMPDSLTAARELERVKNRISFYNTKMWAIIRPGWGFVMDVFWVVAFPFLLLASSLMYYWAKFASAERFPRIHAWAANNMVLAVGLTVTVLVINIFMTLMFWELHPLALVLCMGAVVWLAFRISAWAVPNFPGDHGPAGGRTYPGLERMNFRNH